jgi:hypothetical protein
LFYYFIIFFKEEGMSLFDSKTLQLAAITLAFSSAAAQAESSWNGGFIEGGTGLLVTDPTINAATTVHYKGGESGSFVFSSVNTSSSVQLSGIGEVAGGYMHSLKQSRYALGFDVFVNGGGRSLNYSATQSRHETDNVVEEDVTLSTVTHASLDNMEYGFDALPGFLQSDATLFFGRIGVAFNTWHISTSNTFSFDDGNGSPNNAVLNGGKTASAVGLRLGLGFAHHMNHALSWTANYICTIYNKPSDLAVVGPQTAGTDTISNGFTNTSSASFVTHAFLVGLRYQF